MFDVRNVLKNQLTRLRERDHADPAKIIAHENRYADILLHLPLRPTVAEAFVEFAKRNDFPFWQEA